MEGDAAKKFGQLDARYIEEKKVKRDDEVLHDELMGRGIMKVRSIFSMLH
jgi:hypothetical protein